MSAEPTLLDNPLERVAKCLADMSATLDELWHDLQDLKGELVLRQDVEYRLCALENLVHDALMSSEGDDNEPSPF